jgi:hypothetical protein
MGEIRNTPKRIVLHDPTTGRIELVSQNFFYGDQPFIEIVYHIIDSNGVVLKRETTRVKNEYFAQFVQGFGNDMKTRGDAVVWADIKKKYQIVDEGESTE